MTIANRLKALADISALDILRVLRRLLKARPLPITPSGLTAYQNAELQKMREANHASTPPFRADEHWQALVALFDRVFRDEGIRNPEEQEINQRFAGYATTDSRLHRYACWMYHQLLRQRDSLNLLQRINATCRTENGFGYHFRENTYSLDLLFSIDDFYNAYELCPSIANEPCVVAELGAGWGRFGYVLLTVNPLAHYVVFDLPEPLVISQSYLPSLFNNLTYQTFSQSRRQSFSRSVINQASAWFLGPQDLKLFEPATVDVALNIGSFQEMSLSFVKAYLDLFDGIAASGHCYTRQLKKGEFHGHHYNEISGLEEYPFPSRWEQRFLRTTLWSDDFFEAGFDIPSLAGAD